MSKRKPEHDVIVVGAGPAGSTCAAALAAAGGRVLMLERDASPGDSANCTGIIGHEAFDTFDLPWALANVRIRRIRFGGPAGREVLFDSARTLAGVVRRRSFDTWLAARAAALGAELQTGVTVTRLSTSAHGVEVWARRSDGRDQRHCGRALVLAVGYNVSLLRQVGVNPQPRFVQGAQLLAPTKGGVNLEDLQTADVLLGRGVAEGGFGWIVPVDAQTLKIGVATQTAASQRLKELLERHRLAQSIDLERARVRTSPIPLGRVESSVGDRLLLVGECAGQVKTTSHGGIFYGMLGGRIAAATLTDALAADDLSAGRLRAYEAEWHRLLGPEIRAGLWLRRRATRLSDVCLAGLMQFGRIPPVMNWIRARADFDWHRPLIEDLRERRSGRRLDSAPQQEVVEPLQPTPGLSWPTTERYRWRCP